MLQTLRDEKLYAKLCECEFWLDSVSFLVHMEIEKGSMVYLAKIAAIREQARPITPTEIQVCDWKITTNISYRASIVAPLTKMTLKKVSFQLFDISKASFQKLKDLLTSTSILTLSKKGMGFTSFVMIQGLGWVLC